ncbi:RTA1 domain protein [Sporothrix brasiliensis 5110]|uniref:RTA1 domain protein n=1 Tax=Sporothrix brasiliensis 5110 TaxID=1398154 RepID=A0A0C2F560_9PEZI|nr:RTA1 domain protein [Sporothrix brasiliensis 5110]KIH94054.1 RTA1 domain protein [Sporothrix brasiliensis 5110]
MSATPSPTVASTASSTSASASPSCTTAVPGKYGYVPIDACNSYYNFDPGFAPAVATAAIFGLLTLTHLVQAIVYKKRYAWVIVMAASWETLAFVLHALGAHDQQNAAYSTAYTLLFLLAPLWINGFVYMSFARTVYCYEPDHTVWKIKAVGMSKIFVWADVVTFIIQAAGGVMITPGASASVIKIGIDIYMAGLGCQEFCILVFVGLMVVFQRDCLRLERLGVEAPAGVLRGWRGMLYTLYVVLGLISFRLFYRIAEFAGGIQPSNPVPFHEAYAYFLDAFPMALCLVLLALMHPGRLLRGPNADLPRISRKERKAAKAAKKAARKDEKAQRKAEKQQLGTGKGHVELQQMVPQGPPQQAYQGYQGYHEQNDNSSSESVHIPSHYV